MNEKYIFISYAHKDSDTVVPIIKALSEKYNIWYDDGIEAGSEWPEYIADKLSESDTVIAFVTKNALNSHNCKREINFALGENKDMIIVYLEEVELTRGMKMQLGMLQAVYYNRYSSIEQFIDKLSSSEFITDCLKNTKKTINPVELEEDEDEQEDDYISSTEPTQGLDFSFIREGCSSVSLGGCKSKHIVIPEKDPLGRTVVEIAFQGFMGSEIKSVVFPSSVKTISSSAFKNCFQLKRVALNDGLENIYPFAFDASGITEIEIPKTVKIIYEHCFSNCVRLEKLKLNEGLKIIKENAFYDCKAIKRIVIPKGVEKLGTTGWLGDSPFNWCDSLTELYIPSSVKKMKRPDVVYGKKLTIYYEGSKLFRSTKDVEVVLNASMPKE